MITNEERIKIEMGFDVDEALLLTYAMEEGLDLEKEYEIESLININKIVLKVLESISNNTKLMKNYKTEDISVTHFYTNLLKRIDDLRFKIREMEIEEQSKENDGGIFYFFSD